MKRNVLIPVYCILVGIIFLGTVIYSGTSLYKENNKGYTESKVKFDSMSAEIKKAFEDPYSSNLADKLYKAVGDYNDYAYISIKVNGNTVFLYPGDLEEPSENTKLSKHYIKTITTPELNLSISANVYTLKPASIAWHAKTAFIIILIFTILTILIIVYISMNNPEEEIESIENEISEDIEIAESDDEPETEKIPDEAEYEESVIDSTDNTPTETAVEIETIPAEETSTETSEPEAEAEMEPETEAENLIKEEAEVESPADNEEIEVSSDEEIEATEEEEKEPVEEVELPVADCKPSEEAPNGLFNPETGFGWESYLVTRLDNELSRASASEFDVVLFLIKIPELKTLSCEKFEQLCSGLTNIFQFKDFIFEYKENSFAAIKTNTTIDEAIPLADQIYSEISGIVESGKCFIGLSSKTIRLIGAERLIKEADAALSHAEEDPENPIIAFRADAEKYMDFIEKN